MPIVFPTCCDFLFPFCLLLMHLYTLSSLCQFIPMVGGGSGGDMKFPLALIAS